MFYGIFSCKSTAINGFGPSCESCLASDILFWSWLCLTNFATADANQHQIFGSKGTRGECCREFIPHDISCGKKDSCSHRSINHRGILCAWPRLLRKCGQNPVVPKIGGHGLAFIRQGGCNLRNECKSAKVYREFSWIFYTYVSCYVEWCLGISIVPCGFLCHVGGIWPNSMVLHSKSGRQLAIVPVERHQAKSSGYELGNRCHFGVFLYISLYPCDNRWAVLFKGAWPASRDGMLWLPWLQSYAVANSSCTASADPLQNFSNYPKSWWVSFVWLGTCPDYWHLNLGCFNLDAPAGSQCLLLARWRPIRPLPR